MWKAIFQNKLTIYKANFTISRQKNYKKSLLCGLISQTSAGMPPKNGGVRKALCIIQLLYSLYVNDKLIIEQTSKFVQFFKTLHHIYIVHTTPVDCFSIIFTFRSICALIDFCFCARSSYLFWLINVASSSVTTFLELIKIVQLMTFFLS
jgi:hypothetical protein